jgi:hypothetical protein
MTLKRKRRAKVPDSPNCSAPGCPLRYYYALSNGEGYCRFHHGVENSERVHEITKRINALKPVFRQVARLNSLNASQLLGYEYVPVESGLPDICKQRENETFSAWCGRLSEYIDVVINSQTNGVVNG